MSDARTERFHRRLVLDELFDLRLYEALVPVATGDLKTTLEDLIGVEAEHHAFWQRFFGIEATRLGLFARIRLALFVLLARVFGNRAIHLVLEGIEIYGVRKYLSLWDAYKDGPFGAALKRVLNDELLHEDRLVSETAERRINPERIRNLFLGMNDGLVETLGAVAGFFGAFDSRLAVVFAASTTAFAGALSMGAGAWAAASSEREVKRTAERKRVFLGEASASADATDRPMTAALIVGLSYVFGALVPVLPLLAGAHSPLVPALAAGTASVAVSGSIAFLSGMNVPRRVLTNLLIVAGAAAVTYVLGRMVKTVFGVAI